MIGEIIHNYMGSGNRKLTVPGLGAFMRKDSGEVVFVDLIRRDDGVLRGLVEAVGGYSGVEAMALVDRFVFDLKNDLEKSGRAEVAGFGTIVRDGRGICQFAGSPLAEPAPASLVVPMAPLVAGIEGAAKTAGSQPAEPAKELSPRGHASVTSPVDTLRAGAASAGVSQRGVSEVSGTGSGLSGIPRTGTVPANDSRPGTYRAGDTRRQGHTSVRPPLQARPQQGSPAKPARRNAGSKGRKPDTLIIVAVIAAVVAIIIMIYGLSVGDLPFLR